MAKKRGYKEELLTALFKELQRLDENPWKDVNSDGELHNHDRAELAGVALQAFAFVAGQSEDLAKHDPDTVLGDLLADLHHWADRRGVDWETAVSRGEGHYDAELVEQPPDPDCLGCDTEVKR